MSNRSKNKIREISFDRSHLSHEKGIILSKSSKNIHEVHPCYTCEILH